MKTFIDSGFWSDPEVEELDAKAKLAFLWCITNQSCNLAGFTKVSHRRFRFDTGLEVDDLKRAIRGLS